MSQYLTKFLYLTRGHYRSLIATILAFFLISGLEILGTGIIGPFIAIATRPDFIASNRWLNLAYTAFNFSSEREFLIGLGALAIVAFYIKAFLSFQAQKSVFKFGYVLKRDLSCKLMKSYLAAPYNFHLNINSANLIQDIISTTDNVCLGVVMPALTSLSNLLVTVALMVLLIKTDAVALILIGMLLLAMLVLVQAMKHRLARWGKEGWQAAGEMIRILNHGLGGLKETRVLGCEAYFQQQMEEQSAKFATNLTLAQGYGNLPRYAIEALMLTFVVGFTLLFVTLDRGDRDLGAVLGIFGLASIRLLPAAGNLVSGANVIRANSFAVDKLYLDLKHLETEVPSLSATPVRQTGGKLAPDRRESMSFDREIVLESINFQYPQSQRLALADISLTISKGQSIGIIGKSGSGKTTLVDVMLGLFSPQSGDIKVDGRSIYRDLRAWQNILGYVPQSIFLIDDTLERNIAFGVADGEIDRVRLQQAIDMAQLQDVVENLPNGIHTLVGERGVLLSGGQRQRVGIARVLYHQREVLVFDEATAALDHETERLVTEATKALSGNKTIIIIAHRLSTIEHCDRIYQLDGGRIIKSGSYREVVATQP